MIGEDVSYTLATSQDQTMFAPDNNGYIVRRLTPTECERLQYFPDGYTLLSDCNVDEVCESVCQSLNIEDEKEKNKMRKKIEKWKTDAPDSPRYKALGNSMTTTVIQWLGMRIEAVDNILAEKE